MSADLERRLRIAFRDLPGPGPDVGERAERAALRTLPAPRRRHARARLLVSVAAVVGAAVLGAAALAASGQLRLQLGAPARSGAAVATHLTFPPHTHGIAIIA